MHGSNLLLSSSTHPPTLLLSGGLPLCSSPLPPPPPGAAAHLLQQCQAPVDVARLPQQQPLTARLAHTLTASKVYQEQLRHLQQRRQQPHAHTSQHSTFQHGSMTDRWQP